MCSCAFTTNLVRHKHQGTHVLRTPSKEGAEDALCLASRWGPDEAHEGLMTGLGKVQHSLFTRLRVLYSQVSLHESLKGQAYRKRTCSLARVSLLSEGAIRKISG
jgi:hypothetical protein